MRKYLFLALLIVAIVGAGLVATRAGGSNPTRRYFDYSRSEWGANPEWDSRLNVYAPGAYRVESPDLDTGQIYRLAIQPGQLISLPDQPQTPTGITIHDTGAQVADCDYQTSIKTIQAIQRYHALTAFGHLAWGAGGRPDPRLEIDNRGLADSSSGDIGYHFLIDCAGRIFEGRAGGIYAEGQHVHRHNAGQVGIALIGSFSSQPPGSAQREALVKLTTNLCRNLGINPLAPWREPLLDGSFRELKKNGRTVLSVAGHGEFPDNDHTDPGKLDMSGFRQEVAALVR